MNLCNSYGMKKKYSSQFLHCLATFFTFWERWFFTMMYTHENHVYGKTFVGYEIESFEETLAMQTLSWSLSRKLIIFLDRYEKLITNDSLPEKSRLTQQVLVLWIAENALSKDYLISFISRYKLTIKLFLVPIGKRERAKLIELFSVVLVIYV